MSKSMLITAFILMAVISRAQQPKFTASGSGSGILGAGKLGLRFTFDLQRDRTIYSAFGSIADKVFGSTPVGIDDQISQVGILMGYDLIRKRKTALTINGGLSYGIAAVDEWTGKYRFNKPEYQEVRYSFIGIPVSLSFNWYFCSFMGMKLSANGTCKKHFDYSFGIGLVFGRFTRNPSEEKTNVQDADN